MKWKDRLYILLLLIFLGLIIESKARNTDFKPPGIIYPEVDDFEEDCLLPNGVKGTCRNIKHCPAAVTARSNPTTCYFEGFEQFVCCKLHMQENIRESPSRKACQQYYPPYFAIVNGIITRPKEFPYMVALGWESWLSSSYEYFCGGVLISPFYVLTAAHCGRLNGLYPKVALPGGVNLTDTSATAYKIAKVIIHPEYRPGLSYHDIALVQLSEAIYDLGPACIWNDYALQDNNVTAIGYGQTKFAGKPSKYLLKAHLLVTTNEDCKKYYRPEDGLPLGITEKQMCAKDPEDFRDTCQGDSGGPIVGTVMDADIGRPYVFGITSFGQNCAGGAPGVYTRISEYIDWIEGIVWPGA